jgi:hypothetical protein
MAHALCGGFTGFSTSTFFPEQAARPLTNVPNGQPFTHTFL